MTPDILIIYSYRDREWLYLLNDYLRRYGMDSTTIEAVEIRFEGITEALLHAKSIVFLVSPDFLVSAFVHEYKFSKLLERAEQNEVHIQWIAIDYCARYHPFAKYLALNDPSSPLTLMRNHPDYMDFELGTIVKKIVGTVHLSRSLTTSPINFSAYHPKEIVPSSWESCIAYIFYGTVADLVSTDAKTKLGEKLRTYRRTSQTAKQKVRKGAMVTATFTLPGFQVNPRSLTLGFYEEWYRFDFRIRAKKSRLNKASNGTITFTVEGVIIADIPISVFVTDKINEPETRETQTKAYQAVFCSYSHKDEQIVKRVEAACKALGMEYLRDVTTLRSGQKWKSELENMIERADIFQLFWSGNAAKSRFVKKEWKYALSLNRENFIRPVAWVYPIQPNPPKDLCAIHFAYQPELQETP